MSDWKEEAARHKQDRQAPIDDTHVQAPAKKDTKSWCKGKVGREHSPKVFAVERYHYVNRLELCCEKCGKVLETFWRNFHYRPKPDWVIAYEKENGL